MPRHSEIEAKAIESRSGEPPRSTVVCLLNEHTTITNVAEILGVSVSALFRYVEKNNIVKEVRWVDKPHS